VRGVAHDPVLRAKLMAQHEAGIPLSMLSERHGIARTRFRAVPTAPSSPGNPIAGSPINGPCRASPRDNKGRAGINDRDGARATVLGSCAYRGGP